jgi:predicted nucleotidyltransferase
MNAKEIIITIEKRKDDLKKFGVKKIGLFGSYLHGKQKRGSDIDLLVTLNEEGYKKYFDLWAFLDKVLKRKVDLVIEKNLYPRIKYVINEARYVRL